MTSTQYLDPIYLQKLEHILLIVRDGCNLIRQMHTTRTFMQLLSVIRAHNKRENGTIDGKRNVCEVDVSLSDMVSP